MVTALVISNIVLWLVVVALALTVLALLRQVGVLHERIAPAGALMNAKGLAVGESAPVVDALSWSGREIRVGAASPDGASTLLFFVSPTCPVCKVLLPVVASIERAEGRALRVILASDGPRDEHEAFVARHAIDGDQYVLSRDLGMQYQVDKLPHAVLIDADGMLRARGLVNSREHLESLFEARDRGVASLQDYLATDRDATGRSVA